MELKEEFQADLSMTQLPVEMVLSTSPLDLSSSLVTLILVVWLHQWRQETIMGFFGGQPGLFLTGTEAAGDVSIGGKLGKAGIDGIDPATAY